MRIPYFFREYVKEGILIPTTEPNDDCPSWGTELMDGSFVKLFICDQGERRYFINLYAPKYEYGDPPVETVSDTDDSHIADVQLWDAIDLHGGVRRRFRLLGGKKKRTRKAAVLGSKPVSLMRLVEVEDVDEILEYAHPDQLWVEMKFNGWLVQAVGGRLYTRRGKDLTRKFPEIMDTLSRYRNSHILGELVYWNSEGVMDEPAVTHVAGTKDPREARKKLEGMPGSFQVVAFDILYHRKKLTQLPTWERRVILEGALEPTDAVKISQSFPFASWSRVYKRALERGGDGIVVKNAEASYEWGRLGQTEPRPVGYWWKLKPVKVDDFIVYGTSRGPKGSLLALLAQYSNGVLLPIGKVNNFSEEVEHEILERLKKGLFVMEVAYQSRFPKPPGKLQHPRFERFRDDKDPTQVHLPARYAPQDVEEARKIIRMAGEDPNGNGYARDAGGEITWGKEAAGLLIVREDDGRILLALRSREVVDPGIWGIPGGKIEPSESPEDAAFSEAEEELGSLPHLTMHWDDVYRSGDFTYTTFLVTVSGEEADSWVPELNWEHDRWRWMTPEEALSLSNLHPNVRTVIEKVIA